MPRLELCQSEPPRPPRFSFIGLLQKPQADPQRTQASPTVYTFPAPSRVSALFASLHSSGGPEPGLILVSSDGQVHMWDSLEAALAKVDRFHTVKATLEADEQVERICCIDVCSHYCP